VILFRMIEILFRLFVENNNKELRRTITILSSPQNNKIAVFLLFWNNKFTFGYTTVIFIPKTTAILLFLTHPNIPYIFCPPEW
jgi:hypothetical protein